MEQNEKKVWGIHAKDDTLFIQENVIAIGWEEMGNLSLIENTRDAFKNAYATVYPNAKKGSIPTCAGMLYRFLYEIEPGDYVVFPAKTDRQIYIGMIEGEYYYEETAFKYKNRRKVRWIKHFPRMTFTQGALYEIGAAQTLFLVKNYMEEFLATLNEKLKKTVLEEAEDISVGATADSIKESTKDFILKELSRQLKGYDLEDFVAELLRAMGYRTKVAKRGGDRGIDIIAYKDELPPRILVQVKSQDGDIVEQTILSLKGAMREGDYGLFVTLSNYKKNAQAYLDNTPIIRGINGEELVELVLKYYENLGEKYRKLIPLEKVYIPVLEEAEE